MTFLDVDTAMISCASARLQGSTSDVFHEYILGNCGAIPGAEDGTNAMAVLRTHP